MKVRNVTLLVYRVEFAGNDRYASGRAEVVPDWNHIPALLK